MNAKRTMNAKKTLLTAGLVFALGATGATAANVFHFALSRSAPAADATVGTPDEVRLWFTQAPQDGSVGIRLVNAAGDAVATTEPTVDTESGSVFFVKPNAPLAAGGYTVSWRGVGDDGHTVRGEFGFSVRAE